MRKLLWLTVLLALTVTLGACAGKQASTPAAQAVLDADRTMHQIALDHMSTAAAYAKGCNAAARTIDVATCNRWDTFDTGFRVRYRQTGNALEAVKTSGTGQAAVDADIVKLKTDLQPYVK